MGVFDNQISTARRLITKFGQSVTWRQITPGTPPDPTRPQIPGESVTTDNSVMIAFFNYSTQNQQLIKYIAGSEVTIGSLWGLMPHVEFEPRTKDIVLRDGKELIIKSADLLSPNGEEIMWTVEFQQ